MCFYFLSSEPFYIICLMFVAWLLMIIDYYLWQFYDYFMIIVDYYCEIIIYVNNYLWLLVIISDY